MANDVEIPGTLLSIEARLAIAVHHESGHIVIAAAMGLPLRPEGIMADTEAEGLACYCKQPKDTDDSRDRVMLATFAVFLRRIGSAKPTAIPNVNTSREF